MDDDLLQKPSSLTFSNKVNRKGSCEGQQPINKLYICIFLFMLVSAALHIWTYSQLIHVDQRLKECETKTGKTQTQQVSVDVSQSRSKRALGPDEPTYGESEAGTTQGKTCTQCELQRMPVVHFDGSSVELGDDDIFRNWQQTTWSNREFLMEYRESSGLFQVKRTGLYFIYVQMLFMKNKGDLGTGFILRRDRPRASSLHPVFGCMDSVSKGGTQLYRPCSANGVVDLEEGDFLYIQASFRKRILEKTGHHAGTHFGAIYLGPAGKKHK